MGKEVFGSYKRFRQLCGLREQSMQDCSYVTNCSFGGITKTTVSFSNSLERLTEFMKAAIFISMVYYRKGYGLKLVRVEVLKQSTDKQVWSYHFSPWSPECSILVASVCDHRHVV